MEDNDKPLTMRLAEEGVDEPVAYEAAAEAEQRRLEAERERMKAKTPTQTFVEEADIPQLVQVLMEGAVKAFAAGQGVQQRQQASRPVVTEERREPPARPEKEKESADRSPLHEEVDLNVDDS